MSVQRAGGPDTRRVMESIEAAVERAIDARVEADPALAPAAAFARAATEWAMHVAGGAFEGARRLIRDLEAQLGAAAPAATAAASAAPPPNARVRAATAAGSSTAPAARAARATPARPATPAAPRAARATTPRATAARRTTAPKPPIDNDVFVSGRKMNQLTTIVKRAAADGTIDATEKATIKKLAQAGLDRAEGLVAAQGKPAVFAHEAVLRFLDSGQLAVRTSAAVDALKVGRQRMLDQAKADRAANPFATLPGRGWAVPFHGVRTKDFTFEGSRVNVVAIDLADPRVQLQTNGPAGRGTTVERQARRKDAEIAINGDFFSWGSYRPSGVAMTNGVRWGGSGEPMLAFNGAHADVVRGGSGPDWATNIVSGRPMVLKDGVVPASFPNNGGLERRTGVGLSKDGRVMYMVASPNMSARGLGRLLKHIGADEGIANDAGGSAQMYQKGRGMVMRSSDSGGARAVANTILIQARRP